MSSPNYTSRVIQDLESRLPLPAKTMLDNGTIVVEQQENLRPDVKIVEEGNRSFRIIVNSGMPKFIYQITRALSTRFQATTDNQILSLPEIGGVVQIISDIIWWYQEFEEPFGPEYNIKEFQKQLADMLSHNAECFLLAHEFGHVIFQPEPEITPERLIEQLIWGTDNVSLIGDTTDHERENMADIIALNTVMGVYLGEPDKDFRINQLRYAGATLTFEIYNMLENIGLEFSTSHPPFEIRVNMLREHIESISENKQDCQQLLSLSEAIHQLFCAVTKIIKNPSDRERIYTTEARELVDQLDDALIRFGTGENAPEFGLFYIEAMSIFSKGYYHVLFKYLASRFEEKINWNECLLLEFKSMTAGSLSNVEVRKLKNFWVMKLLVGFFSRQNNPLGYRFLQLLDTMIIKS